MRPPSADKPGTTTRPVNKLMRVVCNRKHQKMVEAKQEEDRRTATKGFGIAGGCHDVDDASDDDEDDDDDEESADEHVEENGEQSGDE